jgi:quercetin dioxygenase-like cupin family protein
MAFGVISVIQRPVFLTVGALTLFSLTDRLVAMKKLNRRQLCVVLFACAVIGSVASEAQTSVLPGAPGDQVLSQPRVFPFDQLPISKMANGGESRNVVRGALVTGEVVALHESELQVGSAPNPQHKIEHSEFITVLDGTLAFEHDGKSERVGPGGVIFVAFGVMHTLRNVGDVPARYIVVAIGGDTKK